jgi:hypothetical protein
MPIDRPADFADVLACLAHDGVRHVIVGGVAVVLHGHVRPIADLDLVVDSAPAATQQAMRSLAAAGFVSSLALPLAAVVVLRLFDAKQREVDAFARYPVPFAELERDALAGRAGDVPVRFASREHLIRAKRAFGRAHDLQDVAALERMTAPSDDGRSV